MDRIGGRVDLKTWGAASWSATTAGVIYVFGARTSLGGLWRVDFIP